MLRVLLIVAAGRLALRLTRGARLAAVAFPDVNFVVLVLCVLWAQLTAPGSAARWWARFAIWGASSSFTLGVVWGWVGPPRPTLEAVVWGIAAFNILASLYLLIFH